ncbi:phosphoglycerol transferase MdoB-like AlkP superfamily enzyme [Bradyrhizobium sp. USDA 4461]
MTAIVMCQATSSTLKIVAVGAIFFGEALSIIAELVASKQFAKDGGDMATLLPMFLLISFGGILLVFGYALGYMYLENIWVIIATSVGAILVVEPILTLLLFRDVPTVGSLIGLALGVLGTLAALFL